ncbi:MAG: signal peptidase I [Alphaproteobacteria bacterium]|nr:signal peptidase I [Alphaproteobacteria bacterium]
MSLETDVAKRSESGWWEMIKIVLQALAIAMVVRVFFYQPFNIPSGSMKDTLLIGDYLFVSKLSYGYSRYSFPFGPNLFEGRVFGGQPKRGDVAVFKLPRDNSTDYIKRVIGLPGDEIMVRGGIVFLNGKELPRKRAGVYVPPSNGGPVQKIAKYIETLPSGVSYTVLDAEPNGFFDNAGPYKVPAGHYFMMGDNRDNSTDSRATWDVGFVPYQNLIGRAEIIFFSAAVDEHDSFRWYAPWAWPLDVRWGRIFNYVK